MRNKEPGYILNPLFGICLFVLLINDLWLKEAFHNELTGKLSDVSGLIACLLFVKAFWTSSKYGPMVVTALVFTIWNSALATPFIESANNLGAIFSRTIDWTDQLCLILLPLADRFKPKATYRLTSFVRFALLIGVLFIFCQTTCNPYRQLAFYDGLPVDPEFKLRFTGNEAELWQQVQWGFQGAEVRRDSSFRDKAPRIAYHILNWPADSTFLLDGAFSFSLVFNQKKNKSVVEMSNLRFFPDSTYFYKRPVDPEDVQSICNDYLRFKLYRTSGQWR